MFLTRTCWPIGSASGNSCVTSVWPITQTLVAPVDVALGEELAGGQRPVAHERVIGADAEHLVRLPVDVAADDLAARADERRDRQDGGTLRRRWPGRRPRSASATVPWRTPPLWLLAGRTTMTLEPRFWNSFCTSWPAPWPIDTIVVTAAMPMTTPSTVSPERSLFLASVRSEMSRQVDEVHGRYLGAERDFGPGDDGLALGQVAVHKTPRTGCRSGRA